MQKTKVIIHGLGNIGKGAIEALERAKDLECLGVIRRKESLNTLKNDLRGLDDFSSLKDLIAQKGRPDVAIICGPSKKAPDIIESYLAEQINTVDSFDIHSEIPSLVERLEPMAKKNNATSIIAAGWDPGTDSVIRALFEAMTPAGVTFTNFGPGRSMGHSVAARSIEGVESAISITIPQGAGTHSRLVYVVIKNNFSFQQIVDRIKQDPYFQNDPLTVKQLDTLEELENIADNSHGVVLERIGASGHSSNQRLSYQMKINNPALTSQILVSCARAAKRLTSGVYTMIDIPPVSLLPGERLSNIKRLV